MSKETVLNRILEMLNKITDTDYLPYQDLMEEGGLSSLELMELIVGMEPCLLYTSPSPRDTR